jgi:predicted Rossmann fold nucleotide-binding protein DprA/Smf involved in DNA uptake
LSPGEWGRFAQWLTDEGITPDRLIEGDPSVLLAQWTDRSVTLDRIQYLLRRSAALGVALEKWERAGLWVLTRGDADYPSSLKRLLGREAPPVLIGSGNRSLLNRGGVAIVGSRDATDDDLLFAVELGRQAAQQNTTVISGGAAGVDEHAMLGALQANGCAVGVLADRLLRSATSSKYRDFLISGALALVSSFNPEAGFDVGNAMARNKYVYCLADAAIVVATGRGKGGTWSGAIENLERRWVPLWVKFDEDPNSGASELVQRGAHWLPNGAVQFADLSSEPADAPVASERAGGPHEQMLASQEFYQLFLRHAEHMTRLHPATLKELSSHLGMQEGQLKAWLAQAVEDGSLQKLSKPVRYRWAQVAQQPELL